MGLIQNWTQQFKFLSFSLSLPLFEPLKYLGTWYEIKRTGLIFEFGQRCVKANYKLDSEGNVAVNNSGVNFVDFEIFSLGTAKPTSQSNVFAVTFFSCKLNIDKILANLIVNLIVS